MEEKGDPKAHNQGTGEDRETSPGPNLQDLLSIFDGLDEAVYISDPQTYEILFANASLRRQFGEGVGRKCHDAFHCLDAPCSFCTNDRIFGDQAGQPYVWEFQSPVTGHWYRCIDRAIPWPDGRQVRYEMSIDITERKRTEARLRESEVKYSTLVESSLTGIYIDQDEKIVLANNECEKIYGYEKGELLGMDAWRLVHPEDRERTNQIRAKRLRGEDAPSDYEARGLRKDGSTIWVTRRNTRIDYMGKPAILGNIADITQRRQAEEAVRRTNEEMTNFLHAVSHDLKTPIITIQGFASRLLKNYGPQMEQKGQAYLQQIQSGARRMETLVSDLLTLSRGGQTVTDFEEVSMLALSKDVVSGLQDRIEQHRIEILIDEWLPRAWCDADRIRQVFENLVVNAIKFSSRAEHPKIEIGCHEERDFHWFFVKDNGIGIDPEHHRDIFEMFKRLKEIPDEEGTGLGLSIVDRIITGHHGRVWVASEKGQGATFYFTLPKMVERAGPE